MDAGSRPTTASCWEGREGPPPRELLGSEGAAWVEVTAAGGRLAVPEYGVVLTVPAGALPPETSQQVYVSVMPSSCRTPALTERQVRQALLGCQMYVRIILMYHWLSASWTFVSNS